MSTKYINDPDRNRVKVSTALARWKRLFKPMESLGFEVHCFDPGVQFKSGITDEIIGISVSSLRVLNSAIAGHNRDTEKAALKMGEIIAVLEERIAESCENGQDCSAALHKVKLLKRSLASLKKPVRCVKALTVADPSGRCYPESVIEFGKVSDNDVFFQAFDLISRVQGGDWQNKYWKRSAAAIRAAKKAGWRVVTLSVSAHL